MNRCFLIGKVLNEPEFKFIYMKCNISIAYFYIKLKNGSVLKIYGYDDMADYIYRNIISGKIVTIEGELREEKRNIEVRINEIEKLKIY